MASARGQDLFVDCKARKEYELRDGKQLVLNGTVVLELDAAVKPGANKVAVTKGSNGFKDDKLLRKNGAVTDDKDDWFSVAKKHGKSINQTDFAKEFASVAAADIVHLKGYTGISTAYDSKIMQVLKGTAMLVWDGDDPKDDGFTKFVDMYLKNTSGFAVAFKKRYEVPKFNSRWYKTMAAYPGRVTVVAIDYPDDNAAYGVDKELIDFCGEYPGWAQEYFALGRIAMHITKSKRVISAGGGGIAGAEAMAGFGAGVQWTVYALSRGRKEEFPTLCDFARAQKGKGPIELVEGDDANEALAFQALKEMNL